MLSVWIIALSERQGGPGLQPTIQSKVPAIKEQLHSTDIIALLTHVTVTQVISESKLWTDKQTKNQSVLDQST